MLLYGKRVLVGFLRSIMWTCSIVVQALWLQLGGQASHKEVCNHGITTNVYRSAQFYFKGKAVLCDRLAELLLDHAMWHA
jgi:hypothetical protein